MWRGGGYARGMAQDPRIFFAAERKLLAWVRTGLAIIGIGFVVERFGLFIRIIAAEHDVSTLGSPHLSALLGVALVVFGSLTIALGALQHHAYLRSLPVDDRPAGYRLQWATGLAGVAAVLGLALAIYQTR